MGNLVDKPVAGGEGAHATTPSHRTEAAKAAGQKSTADAQTSPPASASTAGSFLAEKKRRGHAALASPPPLPPMAPHHTVAHAAGFCDMQHDVTDAIALGRPKRQASNAELVHRALSADHSTDAGQSQWHAAQQQLAQNTMRAIGLPATASGLGAFLLLMVGNQNEQRRAETTLENLTSKEQYALGKEQLAQMQAAAKAQQKAIEKAEKLAFLKPLIQVFSLLGALTGPFFALIAFSELAGFVVGGAVGGKKQHDGFDVNTALEGADYAAMITGAVTALAMLRAAPQRALEQVEQQALRWASKEALEQAVKAIAKKSADAIGGTSALDVVKKAGQTSSQKADQAAAKTDAAQQQLIAQTETKAGAKPNENAATDDWLHRLGQWARDDGKATSAQSLVAQGGNAAGNLLQAGLTFAEEQQNAKAAKHQALAKMAQVLEEAIEQEGERNQDAVQALIDHRKNVMQDASEMITNHAQASANALNSIVR